jgi:2-amino-4-hydroxy-6-hydroxymethyldihydropteridine diphosphokinase
MESMLELEGESRVLLETPADNVRAVHFYERQGYHILALKPDGRGQPGPLMSVRLEKRLCPFKGPVTDEE